MMKGVRKSLHVAGVVVSNLCLKVVADTSRRIGIPQDAWRMCERMDVCVDVEIVMQVYAMRG